MPHLHPDEPRREAGFVLVAVIWLLVLAAAIVALIMLRARGSAELPSIATRAVRERLALDGAIETVVADRLFKGPNSSWWTLPASGQLTTIGDQSVAVRIASEDTRVDLNDGELTTIDDAFRGLGADGRSHAALQASLPGLRARHQRLRTVEEAAAVIVAASVDRANCWAEAVTLISGKAKPVPVQGSVTSGAFNPLRIVARADGGLAEQQIVRSSGDPLRSLLRSDVETFSVCHR